MKMDYKINERYEKDGIILQNQKYDVYSRPIGTEEEYVYHLYVSKGSRGRWA